MTEHSIELAGDPGQARAALAAAVEGWGAQLEPGDNEREVLYLPVIAGLRRGLVSGPIEILPESGGSRVVFRPETSVYRVHRPAFALLLVAALGSLVLLAWPFFPGLLGLVPLCALLALGGWFMVVSQLRSSGPDEFLETVAAELGSAIEPKVLPP